MFKVSCLFLGTVSGFTSLNCCLSYIDIEGMILEILERPFLTLYESLGRRQGQVMQSLPSFTGYFVYSIMNPDLGLTFLLLLFQHMNECCRLGRSPDQIIKLDANENPYGPPQEVREALGNMPYPNIYPDPETRQLRAALSAEEGIPAENLLVSSSA